MPLDPSVRALMLNSCTWYAYTGQNSRAEAAFAAGVVKDCWIEERSARRGAVVRDDTVAQTTNDPSIDIHFDGGDADVVAMTMLDKFLVASGIETADPALASQPAEMSMFYGPDGDAWMKIVAM